MDGRDAHANTGEKRTGVLLFLQQLRDPRHSNLPAFRGVFTECERLLGNVLALQVLLQNRNLAAQVLNALMLHKGDALFDLLGVEDWRCRFDRGGGSIEKSQCGGIQIAPLEVGPGDADVHVVVVGCYPGDLVLGVRARAKNALTGLRDALCFGFTAGLRRGPLLQRLSEHFGDVDRLRRAFFLAGCLLWPS